MPAKRLAISPNQRFGQCVTIETEKHGSRPLWRCRCDCGQEFLAYPTRLNSGRTKACAKCIKKINAQPKVVDLTGKLFGRLTVLSREGSTQDGKALWKCECSCGSSPLIINGHRLTAKTGPTRSCGCLKSTTGQKRQIDLKEQRFGQLVVKKYLKNEKWECVCDCGTTVVKKGQPLREGTCATNCGAAACEAESDFIGPALSRRDAKVLKIKHYSPGYKCEQGHRGSYLVSSMSCVRCHVARTTNFKQENPELTAQYQAAHRRKPEVKENRNKKLKERRETEPVYKFVELMRSRIGKVLRRIGLEKETAFQRNNILRDNILLVLERQKIDLVEIIEYDYELDHIIPLAQWPWCVSHTANILTERAANHADNLQLLTPAQHRKKTREDTLRYKWNEADKGYKDHTDYIENLLRTSQKLPSHLVGFEEKILSEINAYKIKNNGSDC